MRFVSLLPLLCLAACGGTTLPDVADGAAPSPPAAPTPTPAPAPVAPAPATTAPTPAAPAPVAQPLPPAAPAPAPVATPDLSFASLLNNVRITNGAAAVRYDARLDQAAQAYAAEMLAQGRFDHRGADGSTPGTRARDAGYDWTYISENIARGQQSETEVLTAWQGSSGHRRNNLDPRAEDFGLGVVGTGNQKHWVLMLGRAR